MNVLFDRDEGEAVALTEKTDLCSAVESYLTETGFINSEGYYQFNGEILSGREYVKRPDLVRDGFELITELIIV